MDFFADIGTLRRALTKKEMSAGELCRATLDHVEALEPTLRSFITIDRDGAIQTARCVDQKIMRKEPLGALAGIPVAVKDMLITQGLRTTAASRILERYVPVYDGTVVAKLRAADAVIVGKTNLDEFAMGSSTENSAYGPSKNPWDPTRIPGGSSGGSAAAVAGGQAVVGIGTDTGGSIRQPAALCGIAGMKPTYGRVSRYGVIAFASSLDQVGPLARNVTDLATLLGAIAGHDPRDSTSLDEPVPDYVTALEGGVRGMTLGVPREYFGKGLDPEVDAAVRKAIAELEAAGAKIVDVSLPGTDHCLAAYYLIAPAEASSNLARYDGVRYGLRVFGSNDIHSMYKDTRGAGFGPEVKRRVMLGTYALSAGYYDAYYGRAQRVRTLIRRAFDVAFSQCDALVCPTSPVTAVKIGAKVTDPLAMYLMDIYTIGANLAGIPGVSVPCGFSTEGLPIGLQVLGKHLDEATILRVAKAYEDRTDWHTKHPTL